MTLLRKVELLQESCDRLNAECLALRLLAGTLIAAHQDTETLKSTYALQREWFLAIASGTRLPDTDFEIPIALADQVLASALSRRPAG
jgi:hypothetical protein